MNIFERIHNKALGIKYMTIKFIKWAPVIWNDEDWDHYYLYIILQYKLKRMEGFFNSDRAMASRGVEEAKKMKTCINLLDRLIKDEYDENAFKEYYKKWGRSKFEWIPIDDEYTTLEITNKKVKTEEDKKQETKDFLKAGDHERKMKKQDVDYLFKYIGKHIESWWD